jgi:hypothetical protein
MTLLNQLNQNEADFTTDDANKKEPNDRVFEKREKKKKKKKKKTGRYTRMSNRTKPEAANIPHSCFFSQVPL